VNKLYFIFPIKGPNNGVKIISNHILTKLYELDEFELKEVNTAQAKSFANFGKFQLFKIFYLFKILFKLISLRKGDYVYMNFTPTGFAFYRDLIVLLFCKAMKAKISIHIHANGLEEKLSFFVKKTLKNVQVILINEDQMTKLNSISEKVCLKNVLPDFYKGTFSIKDEKKPLKLIFFSNLSKQKGVKLLQDIAENVSQTNINIEIDVCGGILDTFSGNIIKELTKKHSFLNYLGPILNEEKKFNLFRNSSFLLFLSEPNYEVYPLVYIEAIMSGLPVISTKQIVVDEIISNGKGFLIENNSISDLINFLHKYEKDRNSLLLLKKINRDNFENNYTYDVYINDLIEIVLHEKRK
jgi:glycosyltransferase involved in cell wall biosynthesis